MSLSFTTKEDAVTEYKRLCAMGDDPDSYGASDRELVKAILLREFCITNADLATPEDS